MRIGKHLLVGWMTMALILVFIELAGSGDLHAQDSEVEEPRSRLTVAEIPVPSRIEECDRVLDELGPADLDEPDQKDRRRGDREIRRWRNRHDAAAVPDRLVPGLRARHYRLLIEHYREVEVERELKNESPAEDDEFLVALRQAYRIDEAGCKLADEDRDSLIAVLVETLLAFHEHQEALAWAMRYSTTHHESHLGDLLVAKVQCDFGAIELCLDYLEMMFERPVALAPRDKPDVCRPWPAARLFNKAIDDASFDEAREHDRFQALVEKYRCEEPE